MQPTFWVYEDCLMKANSKIHRAECAFCKGGRGFHDKKTWKMSQWHGFMSYAEATAFMASKGLELDHCRICLREAPKRLAAP